MSEPNSSGAGDSTSNVQASAVDPKTTSDAGTLATSNAADHGSNSAVSADSAGVADTDSLVAGLQSEGSSGPINLQRIRELRLSQQQVFDQRKGGKPRGPGSGSNRTTAEKSGREGSGGVNAAESTGEGAAEDGSSASKASGKFKSKPEVGKINTPPSFAPKVAVPSLRAPLSKDLEDELSAFLGEDLDLDKVLVGDASLQVGHLLSEGQRMQATIVKLHSENVFVSMGGPNEGVLSILQFPTPPNPGDVIEVVVRGYLSDEGIYELTMPGAAVDASDWSEIKEGEVVEATITAANTGGLECKVGNIRGFIPASQIAPYRVENMAEFVGQKALCVITEANERRGNLVLSRRAVLERERVEQRNQRLAALEVGAAVKGVVRKITDFGAFVDLGGLDGLLHISQLSWERIKHPGELLTEGQEIHVRIDKIDPQTGKIGLSYRSLQEHPWTNIQTRFPVGSIVKGTVSRIAEFGAFVRIATGVEGLIHLSELAHYRVTKVSSVVQEGQEIEVKVLSIDEEKQRMSLSAKAIQAPPASSTGDDQAESAVEEEAPRRSVVRKNSGPLRGGKGSSSGGEQFGLKW